ncbi:unnamed protein product [Gongylonema pulchrum]|uniref:Uncharacterized protein n=1 Tax=Gongylonema pulchrum TaxID=637853 RepID=A0A183EH45_9BILA|nr:unnamed protein product [Gongylonema pulchrum]
MQQGHQICRTNVVSPTITVTCKIVSDTQIQIIRQIFMDKTFQTVGALKIIECNRFRMNSHCFTPNPYLLASRPRILTSIQLLLKNSQQNMLPYFLMHMRSAPKIQGAEFDLTTTHLADLSSCLPTSITIQSLQEESQSVDCKNPLRDLLTDHIASQEKPSSQSASKVWGGSAGHHLPLQRRGGFDTILPRVSTKGKYFLILRISAPSFCIRREI